MSVGGATVGNAAADEGSRGDQSFEYSPLGLRLAGAFCGLLASATPGAIAALAVGDPWGWAVGVLAAVPTVRLTQRGLRVALRVTPDELIVSNFWRVYRFAWADVEKVGLGIETMGVMPRAAALFRLRGGRTICAQATPEGKGFHGRLAAAREQESFFAALRRLAPDHVQFLTPLGSDGAEPRQ